MLDVRGRRGPFGILPDMAARGSDFDERSGASSAEVCGVAGFRMTGALAQTGRKSATPQTPPRKHRFSRQTSSFLWPCPASLCMTPALDVEPAIPNLCEEPCGVDAQLLQCFRKCRAIAAARSEGPASSFWARALAAASTRSLCLMAAGASEGGGAEHAGVADATRLTGCGRGWGRCKALGRGVRPRRGSARPLGGAAPRRWCYVAVGEAPLEWRGGGVRFTGDGDGLSAQAVPQP